jgi:glucose/mannose-6-phosphate isomerase
VTSEGDAAALRAADPSDMLGTIGGLSGQVRAGYRAGLEARDLPSGEGVRSIALLGMGGSGLPGDVVRALLQDRLGVPIVVSKGYRLPEFCHMDTLVVAVSYSGNTEETVGAYREAVARGCRIVAICGGGELAARAAEDGVPVVGVTGSFPAPRAALGYLSLAALGVLEAVELGPALGPDLEEAARVVDGVATRCGPGAEKSPARELAVRIGDRLPLVWGADSIGEVAAARWKTQVNENAKRPAFSAALPELDHNEIEGWSAGQGRGYFLVILRTAAEHPGMGARVTASLEAIADAGMEHAEVHAEGAVPMAQLLSLVQIGDYVSCYLALDAGVDPTPIDRIESMKLSLRERG